MEIFDRLNKEENKTIIFITHEMRFSTEYARRTIVMKDGTVILDGLSKDVFSEVEKLREAFVLPPQIMQLAQEVKRLGIRPDILTVQELYGDVKRVIGQIGQ
jgi:energy-coupling factor transporter ATP-binding protein EcfA2